MSTIDELQIKITQDSQSAINGLDALTGSLNRLKDATRGSAGLASLSAQMQKLNTAAAAMQNTNAQISKLVAALQPLSAINRGNINAVITTLSKLPALTTQLNAINLEGFAVQLTRLVAALRPLEMINKSNLNSVINSLLKVPALTKQLGAIDMGAFAVQIQRVVAALAPLAAEMNKVAAGFAAFPARIQRLITQNERLATSNKRTAKSFGVLGTGISGAHLKFGIYYMAMSRVAMLASTWIRESMGYIENVNLFTVAMGEYADEALRYAQVVSKAMGIDVSQWIRNQGIFMQVATAFGVTNDKAYEMSKGLTQLAYDLSSLFNIQIPTSFLKLQSALAGELEPLRRLGYALDVATLQRVAHDRGITQSVTTMTQAQKAQLRYITIIEQSTNVMGDMARTLVTPANALRILSQQVVMFRRALGDLISVVLVPLIPYFQAFVRVVTDAANALAQFLGFTLPTIDYSALEAMQDSAGGAGAELEDAADAAKKLRSATMGFDELNIIAPETPAAAGGGGGLGETDLPIDIKAYENFLAGIQTQIDEIADTLVKPFQEALKLVTSIGIGIAGWKLSVALAPILATAGALAGVKAKIATFGAKVLAPFLKVVAPIATLVYRFIDLVTESENFRRGLDILGDTAGRVFGWIGELLAPLEGAFDEIGGVVGALDLDVWDLVLTFGGLALLFTPLAPLGKAILLFEGITIAIRALGYAGSDAVEEIDLFGKGISEVTKTKVEPFIDKIHELDNVITALDWSDKIVKQGDVDSVTMRVAEIVDTITTELDADKNAALQTLAPLKNALGEEAFNEIIADNKQYYYDLKKQVEENEARIIEIFTTASAEKRALTEEEQLEVNRIQGLMKETGIKHLSETEVEHELIMNRLKANTTRISLEQATEILKNARLTKEGTILDAETQYARITLEAQRMYETGAINKEQYDAIILAAQTAKDETIAAATTQFTTIENTAKERLGETARYIDFETQEIRTKWSIFTEDLLKWWDQLWIDANNALVNFVGAVERGFATFMVTFRQGWRTFWSGIGNFFIDIGNGMVAGFEGVVNSVIGGLNQLISAYNSVASRVPGLGGRLTVSHISSVFLGRVPRLVVPAFALGGFPDRGQMFIARESGAEMVGSIGNRSAVANNDQIVDAVSQGVYRAVRDAMPGQNEQPISVKVYLDGKQITHSIEKIQNERGTTLFTGGVVAYG